MKNLNRNEADLLDKLLEDDDYSELYEARLKKRVKSKLPRKKMPLQFVAGIAIAAIVLTAGVTCVADETSRMMLETLIGGQERGYFEINKTSICNNREFKITHALGAAESEIIYVETNIPYDEQILEQGGAYYFEEINCIVDDSFGQGVSCGICYEIVYRNGKIGYLIFIDCNENINNCNMTIIAKNLMLDDMGEVHLLEDLDFEVKWKNDYKVYEKTASPMIITKEGVTISEVIITPVSIDVKALLNNEIASSGDKPFVYIESATYKDGRKLEFLGPQGFPSVFPTEMAVPSVWLYDSDTGEVLNGMDIISVTINGKEVKIK